jgi:hypothetical protein
MLPCPAKAFVECDGLEFYPATHVGYNQLVKNYDGYTNLWTTGGDIYVGVPSKLLASSGCSDQAQFRLSGEYLPMKVPAGNNGLSEQVATLTFGGIFRFGSPLLKEVEVASPYIGLGAGLIWDMLTVNTPATGRIDRSAREFDLQLSVGLFSANFLNLFRINPEVRLHGTVVPNGIALNAEYLVGFVVTPDFGGRRSHRHSKKTDAPKKETHEN